MTRAKKFAGYIRWLLLVIWVLCLAFFLFWLFSIFLFDGGILGLGLFGTPLVVILGPFHPLLESTSEFNSAWGYIVVAILPYMTFFLASQWLFLCPRQLWKIKTKSTSRPMKRAALGAAFAATLLYVGLLYSFLDLISFDRIQRLQDEAQLLYYLFLSIPLIVWSLWFVLFYVYTRRLEHSTWTSRIIRGLVAGSILELFVATAVYATREDDCYCARGSYAGIIFGVTVLLWAFGPGVFLLFLREKTRRDLLLETGDDSNVAR
ncbi:hypothetical protein ACFL6U_31310 [Planctomycetota bacterium]